MAAVVADMRPIRMRRHGPESVVDDAIRTANVGSLEVSHQGESVSLMVMANLLFLQAPRNASQTKMAQRSAGLMCQKESGKLVLGRGSIRSVAHEIEHKMRKQIEPTVCPKILAREQETGRSD